MDLILGQKNPVHMLTSYFLMIFLDITLPFMFTSSLQVFPLTG